MLPHRGEPAGLRPSGSTLLGSAHAPRPQCRDRCIPPPSAAQELIPTALRYDPQDSVATTCVVLGMVVMAASLLLFTI